MSIQISLNRYVRIKLTAHGDTVLKKACATLKMKEPRMADGRVQLPIWAMMQIFGAHTFAGAPALFEDNMIEIYTYMNGDVVYSDDPLELGWYGP